MTDTQTLTESRRPAGSNNLFIAWETLTNADNPDVAPGGSTTRPTTPPAGGGAGPIHGIGGIGGKCVDVAGASSANGTAVQLYDCNGTAAQSWTVASGGALQALGKCLDVAAAGTANGTKVQLWTCTNSANQAWVLPSA